MMRPKRYPYTLSPYEVEEERIFRSEKMIAKVYKLRNRFTGKIIHDWIEWEDRTID
ncbi:Uncharacterised protein [Streptococcus suis]|uniref:Uncharacterized protein n=1 Tax=Streptococcus suis TaxID=1307 RepID=A0A123UI05_STRSU|nr:Uncharacterised protein [Streptococcus suis]CYW41380.1 Uncharacterised protein [Streptococcus suis]